jgi:hypothetical protein
VDFLTGHHIDCVLNAGFYILGLKVRLKIENDYFARKSVSHQLQHRLHRNARSGNARLAKVYLGADLNPAHTPNLTVANTNRQCWQGRRI